MPLTLEKLFSETVTSSFEQYGEDVHLTWAPSRYTGEMDAFAKSLADEDAAELVQLAELNEAEDEAGAKALLDARKRRNASAIRKFVAELLVEWDVLDDAKKPIPHDIAGLLKLPDWFVERCFNAMSEENQTDPQSAPSSDEGSDTRSSDTQSPTGTPSSGGPKSSKSRRGK